VGSVDVLENPELDDHSPDWLGQSLQSYVEVLTGSLLRIVFAPKVESGRENLCLVFRVEAIQCQPQLIEAITGGSFVRRAFAHNG